MGKQVLIVAPVHQVLLNELTNWGYTYQQLDEKNAAQAIDLIPAFDGLITSTRLVVDENFINNAPNLKWIGRMGSGMEQINVAYALTKGIKCFSSPEGNANAVAEQALGMLIALQHKIFIAHKDILQHKWSREPNRGFEIEGLTAAIIGYGNNGAAFAKKLKAMDVNVLAYDKYRRNFSTEGIAETTDLETIFSKSDIISFHVPLNEETKHYFDEHFLEHMAHPFVLLNLSRGQVVDYKALNKGLASGKITGAALDVWENEPFFKGDEEMKNAYQSMMQRDNFIGTPHIAGYTFQALYKMSKYLIGKIKAEFS